MLSPVYSKDQKETKEAIEKLQNLSIYFQSQNIFQKPTNLLRN